MVVSYSGVQDRKVFLTLAQVAIHHRNRAVDSLNAIEERTSDCAHPRYLVFTIPDGSTP
jgi:hypothetical protein